jgi:flagellar hook-basal body complex protein FliE
MIPVAAASQVSPASHLAGRQQAPLSTTGDNGGVGKLFSSYINQTNQTQVASDQAINDLVLGKTENVQQVIMAVANAEMSFQMFMEIRNKLIESYNELMRMQF